MTQNLDLTNIQGNIVKPYGSFGFFKARYLLLRVDDGDKGRDFVARITSKVTSAERWTKGSAPSVTTNIAFTYSACRL